MTSKKLSTQIIQRCCEYLRTGYTFMFPGELTDEFDLICQVANTSLQAIARSNAPYHDLEHTLQVTLVGHEILQGKQLCDRSVTPSDWFHFIAALLCHDVGYIRGICHADQPQQHLYSTGVGDEYVQLIPEATDASLRMVHVDRSKQFVAEQFASLPWLNVERIQHYIELTRFPVSPEPMYQDVIGYPGLTRAADLIGQLSDPGYLAKIPALFRELEETGVHTAMGYYRSQDLRAAYPKFYRNTVAAYIHHGIRYLEMTQAGGSILATLQNNLSTVEHELTIGSV